MPNNINDAWKSTCRILLGEEIGELDEFENYLKESVVGKQVKSYFSGKRLMIASEEYSNDSRFFDYSTESGKVASLSKSLDINQIKDIDSLLDAVSELVYYAGNNVLGESNYVENSDNVFDCSFVYNSTLVEKSKFVYCCYLANDSDFCFGCASPGESEYVMRCFYNNRLKRCFECCTCGGDSDLYFCYNLMGCQNCMFSFNLRNKQNMVGNVQLDKIRYADLKKKLLGEIADELKGKKRLDYSIISILNRDDYDS